MLRLKLRATFLLFSLFSFLAMQGQEWTLMTPLKSGDLVSGVSFLDEMRGYAVIRASGTVLQTSDGGVSWREPWTPGISTNLYDVEYVSPDTIFTCGVSGEIFRSIDAGNTWIEMSTPTNEWLYALEFINPQIGYASGHTGTLLRTTNGGDDWELLTTNTSNRLMDVKFYDTQLGYACGWNGTLLKTTDGGDNWTMLDSGVSGSLFEVTAPSEDVVYACGWSNVIIKSADGGDSFVTQSDGGITTINYIHFRDEMNGWAAGDFGLFYTTSNGGNTWVQGTLGSANIHCGAYVSEDQAFVMGVGMMYHSTDNGNNWSVLKNFVPNAKYNGIFFHDDLNGTAVGSVGVLGEGSNQSGVIQTYNGGQTWEVRNQGFNGGWWDVHFADENYGFIIGASTLGKTSNGGVDWNFAPLDFDLTGVGTWRHNANEGLVGGQSIFNSICYTSDGGNSFECNDNLVARDFFFLDDDLGWAVHEGSSENILKTTDGGQSWEFIPTGNFGGFYSLHFLDEMTGWVGTSGGCLWTTDGGETWTQAFAGGPSVGIHFYSPEIGFLVDWNNQLFRSDDGGQNWEMILGDYNTITPCQEAVFTENYVYTANWGGNIYRAELGCTAVENLNIIGDTEWCEGEIDLLAYDGSGIITEFEWSLPEGWTTEESDGVIEVIAGEMGGLVGLTVTNACGLTGQAQLAVSVASPPLIDESFTISGATCENQEFTVSVPDDGITEAYDWIIPVGWDVMEDNNVLTVNASNTGSLSLIKENTCGVSDMLTESIIVNPLPEAEFELLNDELCVGASQFLGGGTPGGGIFSGEYVIESNFLDLTDAVSGPSLITYNYTDENLCSASVTDTLFVVETDLIAGTLTGPTELCLGDAATFVLSGEQNVISNSWAYPEGWEVQIDGDSLFVISANSSGSVITEQFGSCFALEQSLLQVMISTAPDAPGTEQMEFQSCGIETEETVSLTGLDGTLILAWEPGLVVISDEDELLVSASEAGEYILEVSQFNECGSSEIVDLSFNFVDTSVQLSFSADSICLGDPIIATLEPFGGLLTGESVEGSQVISQNITEPGAYDYSYSFEFFEGCVNEAADGFYIDICENINSLNQHALVLYPNPASDQLNINWTGDGLRYFALHDMSGRSVKAYVIIPGINELDISELSAGLYMLVDQQNSERHKLIIE